MSLDLLFTIKLGFFRCIIETFTIYIHHLTSKCFYDKNSIIKVDGNIRSDYFIPPRKKTQTCINLNSIFNKEKGKF